MSPRKEHLHRRSVTLPPGWWPEIKGIVAYLQSRGHLVSLASFWKEAAVHQLNRWERKYGPLKVADPEDIRVGRHNGGQ